MFNKCLNFTFNFFNWSRTISALCVGYRKESLDDSEVKRPTYPLNQT